MSENGKRHSYDRAFKVGAVRLVTEKRRRVTEVTHELGINANQLQRWKRRLLEEGQPVFPGKRRQAPEQEELRRLRRQLAYGRKRYDKVCLYRCLGLQDDYRVRRQSSRH